MLGITGNRPLRFLFEGIGVGTGLASKLPSLLTLAHCDPYRMEPTYLASVCTSGSGVVTVCRDFMKYLFSLVVAATSFSLSVIPDGVISFSVSSRMSRKGCRRGFPAHLKIWSLCISDRPTGRSLRRFCITERTRSDFSLLISFGSSLILLRLKSRISSNGSL